MPLLDNEFARVSMGALEVRTTPMRLRWVIDDLVAADGNRLRCTFTCSVRALEKPAERQLFGETFLGHGPAVPAEQVIGHFLPALQAASAAEVGKLPGEQWLTDGQRHALAEALRAAGDRLAFSCGLELLPPFDLEMVSPTLEQQRIEVMQRAIAEKRFTNQLEHFQRAAELLKQFEDLRKSAPTLSPSEILKQISPADQGTMLQMLLMAKAREAPCSTLWAVAGTNLLRVDTMLATSPGAAVEPRQVREAKTASLPLPQTLGPLRSVQLAEIGQKKVLLVGARSGIYLVDPPPADAKQVSVTAYTDPQITSQMGFSRAVVAGEQLWACHSDGGIIAWQVGQPDRPVRAIRPHELAALTAVAAPPPLPNSSFTSSPSGPRNLQTLDAKALIFSSANALMAVDLDGTVRTLDAESRDEINSLFVTEDRVISVYDDGRVSLRARDTLAPLGQSRPAGRITTAAMMPWLGAWRILLATADGPIICVGFDDPLVTQYLGPYRGMRALVAATDMIAALSPDRTRLALWNTWDARQPAGDVSLGNIARHRIADVELA